MALKDKPEKSKPTNDAPSTKVTADYGGRRKVFERRINDPSTDIPDRRSDQERRSGFDRRGMTEDENEKDVEKRQKPVK